MPELDAIDRKILALLQTDSRLTMQELADKVGLSVSPCHRRVKLLEERGVISRYIATVDQKALGLHVSVFISIKLARQKEEDLNRFARAISKWDEVLECYLMTGNRDYLLRVVAADLQPVGAGANVVGVMDSPRRQPQHLAVQRGQHFQACGIDSHGGVSCDGEQVNSNPVGCAKNLKLWQCTRENWDKIPSQPHKP